MNDRGRIVGIIVIAALAFLSWAFFTFGPSDTKREVGPLVQENVDRLSQAVASSSGYQLVNEQIGANSIVQEPEAGESAAWGEDVTIPAGFPVELPRYLSAKTKAAVYAAGGTQASLVQVTDDEIAMVAVRILPDMQAKGFTLMNDVAAGAVRSLQFENAQWRVVVVITRSDAKTGTIISSARVAKTP